MKREMEATESTKENKHTKVTLEKKTYGDFKAQKLKISNIASFLRQLLRALVIFIGPFASKNVLFPDF